MFLFELLFEISEKLLQLFCDVDYEGYSTNCPASAFTAIGAAFATQGYWVQADILYYFQEGGLGRWAPFIYVLAVMGGLVGIAIGAPPRNYMWWLMGPVLYNFLIFTTSPVLGVNWRVGEVPQDMTTVWRIAEPGLRNTNIYNRDLVGVSLGSEEVDAEAPVAVSMIFVAFDELISHTISFFISWTGSGRLGLSAADGQSSNLPRQAGGVNPNATMQGAWQTFAKARWSLLESVTGASLHNADLRDAFVTFLSSECGDSLFELIHRGAFTIAQSHGASSLPSTVFKQDWDQLAAEGINKQFVPMPLSLKAVLDDTSDGSLYGFINDSNSHNISGLKSAEAIRCSTFLQIIIEGFRWEAANLYHAITSQTEGLDIAGVSDSDQDLYVLYGLLYGWNIKEDPDQWDNIPLPQMRQYLQALILSYLFRNEWSIAPHGDLTTKYSSGQKLQNLSEAQVRTVGQKGKFGELHVWTQMIPYVQGILLYYLAIAYPFVCLLIVIPGWHKIVLTWMSFWVWVKLWDLGFALVEVVERTLWAMIGNNSELSLVNTIIVRDLQDSSFVERDYNLCYAIAGMFGGCSIPVYTPSNLNFEGHINVLDKLLILASNLEFDLGNAYYLYIASALYFAVPAVAGQLVLGAKSGAASMASNMISGVSGEAGKGAGSGFTSEMQTKASANFATAGQEATAKSMRSGGSSGFAGAAIGSANQQTELGIAASEDSARSQGLGHMSQARNQAFNSEQSGISAAKALISPFSSFGRGSTGAATGAPTGAPTGDLPGASAAQQVSGGRAAGGAISKGVGKLARVSDPILGLVANESAQANAKDQAGLSANQAAANVSQFGNSANSNVHGLNSQRQGSAAGFQGGMDAWRARRNFGNQLAGATSAMGVLPGSFSPGQKPEDMNGMAMTGMLGAGIAQKARAASEGGSMMQDVANRKAGLNRDVGGQSVQGVFDSRAEWGQINMGTFRGASSEVDKAIDNFSGSGGAGINAIIDEVKDTDSANN